MDVDIENKKRKNAPTGVSSTITNHFPVAPKPPPSSPILKEGKYSSTGDNVPVSENKVFRGGELSYLYLMLDIPSDRDCVEKYRMTLTRLLSAIRQADPKAVIVQYKATHRFSDHEKEVDANMCLDHPGKMPRSITQLHKYFPKGRPKRGGGTVFTNFLLLHDEEIDDIIMDMKDAMEAHNPKIGKQRIQHHSVAKLGYIMCLTTKIEIARWTEFFTKETNEILQTQVLLAISVAKINDGTAFKDDFGKKQPTCTNKKKKAECWGIHIETTTNNQVHVKRAIKVILATKIPNWMHGMELKFIPQIKYDMTSIQKTRLNNAMIKHKQVMANLVDHNLTEFTDIDSPISTVEGKTIRQLIMELKTKEGQTMFVAIEKSWQGELVAWAKRKYHAEAAQYTSHMAAWLVKLHGDGIFAKLDPDIQRVVKSVVWKNNIPLYPEEVEIEDASTMKIDWLIDITELETTGVDEKSITMDDMSVGTFGSKSFFSPTQSPAQESDSQKDTHQSLAQSEQDDTVRKTNDASEQGNLKVTTTLDTSDSGDEVTLVQDTAGDDTPATQSQNQDTSFQSDSYQPLTPYEQEDSGRNASVPFTAQSSQSVEGYDKPSAPEP